MDPVWHQRWMDCSSIMKRNARMGALANAIVGILGALIGGFLMDVFGAQGVAGSNPSSMLVAVFGSVSYSLSRVFRRAYQLLVL